MPDEIQNSGPTFGTVSRIIELLEPLNADDRERVLRTVTTWLRVGLSPGSSTPSATGAIKTTPSPQTQTIPQDDKFSDRQIISVKDFVFEKEPKTETERVACLAYYLTHYLETPHFKNVDLSRLNTEAAQRKLSNPAVTVNNAVREGLLVGAPKDGAKQMSAMGERFVQALPDREAALQIKQRMASRRTRKSNQMDSGEAEVGNQESSG